MNIIDKTLKIFFIITIIVTGIFAWRGYDYIEARWLDDVTPNTSQLDSLHLTLNYKEDVILEKQDSILRLNELLGVRYSQDCIIIIRRYKDSMLAIKDRQVEYFLERTGVSSSNHRDSIVQIPYPNIVIANEMMLERDMYRSLYDSLQTAFHRRQDFITELQSLNDSLVVTHKQAITELDSIARNKINKNRNLEKKIDNRNKFIIGSVAVNIILIILLL